MFVNEWSCLAQQIWHITIVTTFSLFFLVTVKTCHDISPKQYGPRCNYWFQNNQNCHVFPPRCLLVTPSRPTTPVPLPPHWPTSFSPFVSRVEPLKEKLVLILDTRLSPLKTPWLLLFCCRAPVSVCLLLMKVQMNWSTSRPAPLPPSLSCQSLPNDFSIVAFCPCIWGAWSGRPRESGPGGSGSKC